MRAAGISGVVLRKRRRTTVRLRGVRVAADLVERDFRPSGPNQTWAADITYISTWEGFLYLAHVQDLFSRLVVGWSMAEHLRAELVLDALEMALYRRRPERGLIHHSDRGCQGVCSSLCRVGVLHRSSLERSGLTGRNLGARRKTPYALAALSTAQDSQSTSGLTDRSWVPPRDDVSQPDATARP
jgi:transposase InsO family protein